ncbi:hypothetical protein GOQ27_13490 [Clostridium sp. D2Q-11]|uniref:Uncharacterized protein n=1 Tax=Anaeromonas frigoriresistens TaxID=2683708 RepID=A0A942Z9M6_9FIRM|nr:hypothetical protein [Anaeromonas frigoriresistens]MBS4539483.1 hypothetical protein [Anaeromonas frigoriresistens]
MSTYEKYHDIKELYITDFSVWQDYDINNTTEIVIDAINSAEGVYVYRSHAHLLEENDFIKWLKNEKELMYYKEVSLKFREDNMIENFVLRNKEPVYFLEFNKDNKENFLKQFKISIRDIKNRISKENTIKYLEKRIYIDDPLYDQYDFIFTVGNQAILFTDIHVFTFVKAEV